MREIKFRAKSIKTGKFIYGTYLNLGMGLHYIIPILHYYPIEKTNYINYLVDPETVGQFTGLKDKNGKEIFEGDILQLGYGNKERVVCKYVVYGNVSRFIMGDDEVIFTGSAEVIGNIYENPELLGGKNG